MVKVTKMRNAFIHPKTLSFEQLEEAAEILIFTLIIDL